MSERLFQTCQAYFDALEKRFAEIRQNLEPRIISIQGSAILLNAVETAEGESEFQQLVGATQTEFEHIHKSSNLGTWANALGNLLRRAGFYQGLFDQSPISAARIHDLLSDQFQRQTKTVTYLAPLELVWFAGGPMDFGTFQIRRYTLEELEEFLRNSANRTFFRWAETDLNLLTQYWYISVTKTDTHRIGIISFDRELLNYDLSKPDEVKMEWSRFPAALEFPLRTLALFDWKPDHSRLPQIRNHFPDSWQAFSIPFVLKVTDNLLVPPATAPNLTGLALEPWLDQETGKEIGEVPSIPINLDEEETRAFEATIRRTAQLLAAVKIKENRWDFIEVALNYLLKAFFAQGLDQLLWHITVVEALVGENKEGLLDRLKRRVGRSLAKTENDQKTLRKDFGELYDFRSKLVHGSRFEKKAYVHHLTQARDIARKMLIWFLHFAQAAQEGSELYPTRENFLRVLDLDSAERERVVSLAQKLPADFPCIEAWTA